MNQVPVRWGCDGLLRSERSDDFDIPYVPLSALREVVEGLKLLSMQDPQRSHPLWSEWVNGPDYRSKSFKMWLAQRLLASLGEIGK